MKENHPKSMFDQTFIGRMQLRNRFISSSVGDHIPNGQVTNELIKKYEELSKGGVGTILTGFTIVDETERNMNILSIYDDSFIEKYKDITKTVHQNGSNILMQLVSVGSGYVSSSPADSTLMGASEIANINTGIIPKTMTVDDIHLLTEKFANAALRAQKAGFDGVEIHACHNYLLHQFATLYYNHRTDIYGGSIENRYRITLEIYDAIRAKVGESFQVWAKVQSQDNYEGGISNEDCYYLCKELSKKGIDAIEISGNFKDYHIREAYFRKFAEKVASELSTPIIVTGGNRDYEKMTSMINESNISYVGLARPLISQPGLVNEFYQNQAFKSRCVSCNICLSRAHIGRCIKS